MGEDSKNSKGKKDYIDLSKAPTKKKLPVINQEDNVEEEEELPVINQEDNVEEDEELPTFDQEDEVEEDEDENESEDDKPSKEEERVYRSGSLGVVKGNIIIIFLLIVAVGMLVGAFFVVKIMIEDSKSFISDSDMENGIVKELELEESISFNSDNKRYSLYLDEKNDSFITLRVKDKQYIIDVNTNESKINLDNDEDYDLLIKVDSILTISVNLYLKLIPPPGPGDINATDGSVINCTALWQCTDWTSCIDGAKNRSCDDFHHCNSTKDMPELNQSCDASSECTQFARYYCHESENAVYWYDGCGNPQTPKEICDSGEICDFDECVLMQCEEIDEDGEECDSGFICKEETVDSSDVNQCCIAGCETRLCSESAAKSTALNYIKYANDTNADDDDFKELLNIDCSKEGCQSIYNQAKTDFKDVSIITFSSINHHAQNLSSILTYELDFSGAISSVDLIVTNNPQLGGCRVISHTI